MSSLTLPPRCAVTAIETPSRQRHSAVDSLGRGRARGRRARSSPSASRSSARSARGLRGGAVGLGDHHEPRRRRARRRERRRAAASSAPPSRYSSAAGTTPLPSTASIAAQPAATLGVEARRRGSAASGAGISRSQAAVTIPSVPSEPISRLLQVVAGDVLARSARRRGPARRARATASSPVTQAPVTPYLKACGPPAFVAMLPPICDCSAAPGSGGNEQPVLARAAAHARAVVTPASTLHPPQQRVERATRSSRSRREHDAAVDRHARRRRSRCRRRAARSARRARSTRRRPARPPRRRRAARRVGPAAQPERHRRVASTAVGRGVPASACLVARRSPRS